MGKDALMNRVYNMRLFVLFIGIMVISLLFSGSATGQENHLEKRISIYLENIPLGELIYEIGELGGFQFSYNARLIDGNQPVSVQVVNEQVSTILDDLLGPGYQYKVIGNHIIILKSKSKTKVPRSERKREYVISGYIVDVLTGEKIYEASIYEIEGRKVSASDQLGHYSLILPAIDQERYLNYSKVGYLDTVILVRPLVEQTLNISLRPLPPEVKTVEKAMPTAFNMNQTPFIAALVPSKSITMADNVQVIEERFAQISFLPFLGSNRFVSGMLTNRFSLNVLAGYSGGVRGIEVGGLLNMNRGDMKGVQIGGFGNIVGKNTEGVQVGGFFNVTAEKMTGLQVAGFTNIAVDTIQGIQISGFANFLRRGMIGSQVAGFANFTSQNVDGLQVAGFANVAIKDVKLGQISGFANYCQDVGGVQVAGFTNVASGTNRAVQVAGFLNYATDLHGLQLSVINVADTVSAGVPIGFFSFVRKGFHPIEIFADELFWFNLAFKTGINAFYNAFSAGFNNELSYVGYGLGTQGYITPRFAIGLETNARVFVSTGTTTELKGSQGQIKATFNYKIARHFTITAGPSFNVMINPNDFSDKKYHIGWNLGIRL